MMKRFGTAPKRGIQYRTRPGAYAILVRDGQVLLTFQAEPEPEFQIPGGGIDPGESMVPALRREVFEETGWSIGSPLRIGAFRCFVFLPEYDMWADKICHVFIARPAMRISAPTEQGHHCHWVSPDMAPTLVESLGAKHFLHKALHQLS